MCGFILVVKFNFLCFYLRDFIIIFERRVGKENGDRVEERLIFLVVFFLIFIEFRGYLNL